MAISNIPIPDPSLLTTEQLRRELNGLRDTIETRLDGIDKATILQRDTIEAKLRHMNELRDEKFHSIAVQFKERDTRVEETQKGSKTAIDAALLAAEKAVSEQNKSNAISITKSETTYTKQIEQLSATMGALSKNLDDRIWALTKNMDDKVNDIKDRVTSIEGRTVGNHESVAARNTSNDNAIKFFGIILAGFMALMAVVSWLGVSRGSPITSAQPAAVAVVPLQPNPAGKATP